MISISNPYGIAETCVLIFQLKDEFPVYGNGYRYRKNMHPANKLVEYFKSIVSKSSTTIDFKLNLLAEPTRFKFPINENEVLDISEKIKKYHLELETPRVCRDCGARHRKQTMKCRDCSGSSLHTPAIQPVFKKNFKGEYRYDPKKFAHVQNIIDAQPRKPILKLFPKGCYPVNPNTAENIALVLSQLFPDINDDNLNFYRLLNIVCSDALIKDRLKIDLPKKMRKIFKKAFKMSFFA